MELTKLENRKLVRHNRQQEREKAAEKRRKAELDAESQSGTTPSFTVGNRQGGGDTRSLASSPTKGRVPDSPPRTNKTRMSGSEVDTMSYTTGAASNKSPGRRKNRRTGDRVDVS